VQESPDVRSTSTGDAWRRTSAAVTALAGLMVLLASGCTAHPAEPPAQAGDPAPQTSPAPGLPASSSSSPEPLPRPDHVVVVVFENEDATDIVGSERAPHLSSLAADGAQFTDAHGETHPSQPTYLALFSGSTHGVVDDARPLALSSTKENGLVR
jgi:phosphatidylinositol-3-phosphatase